jgi:PAS domain S-box-containing protein
MTGPASEPKTDSAVALRRLLLRIKAWLPHGHSLPDKQWANRHRVVLVLLWLHAGGLAVMALLRGFGLPHAASEGSVVAFCAAIASARHLSRTMRSAIAGLGLVMASAIFVHLSGGLIEAHFHFFVVLSILTLYQEWVPYLVALAFVVLHHGIVGWFDPHSVYNHPAAIDHPWRWAVVHGAFVLAASVANLVAWRMTEEARSELEESYRQLRSSEERLRRVFQDGPVGMVVVDPELRLTQVNAAFCALLGYSEEELLGLAVTEFIHPDDVERSRDLAGRLFGEEMAGYELEKRYVRRDGQVVWVKDTAAAICDEGRPLYGLGIVEDITERKRAGELQASLAAIVTACDAAILGLSVDLVVTSWNPGAANLFGYAANEARGCHIDFLGVSSGPGIGRTLEGVARGERISGHESEARTKDGRTIPISLAASSIIDANGTIIGLACIAQDISARRSYEDALRASEERFRSLVQKSSDLTLVCDADGALTYVSPASEGILGIENVQVAERTIGELVHPDDQAVFHQRLRSILANGGEGPTLECRVARGDGSYIWAEATVTDLLNDPAVQGVVINLRDVSDRRRLETQLRHAQKMESVGQLAAGIAHEMNTPIQFVGDNVRFVQEAVHDLGRVLDAYREASLAADPAAALAECGRVETEVNAAFLAAEMPEAIEQTLEGVDRVATIVRAMKGFAHPSTEEKAPADLNQAIRNTVVVANNELKYVADVVLELADLPPVWCHLGDVNQVILNLVVNAAHAIRDLVGDSGQRGRITIRTAQDGDSVTIDVIDTGMGIPSNIADRVFEPFFTTKPVGVGTGQGLALAYSLVHDRHSGSITFASVPGAGTTFTVRLPVAPSARASSAADVLAG